VDDLYLMTPTEVAWGFLVGQVGTLPEPRDAKATPRQALERVVRDALVRPPCGVAFSGGRDSSLVLAIATHVARREGLPEPIPITRVFPGVPDADEREWQEKVVRHLSLHDWHRVVIHDELDVIGPLAERHLVKHGVIWPTTVAGDIPLVEAVPGGSVLDGEGGDEVLGTATHRIAPLASLVRAPRPLRRHRLRGALGTIAPSMLRSNRARLRWLERPPSWLKQSAQEEFVAALAKSEVERPLSFRASVRMVPTRRTQRLGGHNRRQLARALGVEISSPLLHADLVHAVARDGGVFGAGDRTAVLRALVPDLLPDEVLARTSKAVFTRCYMGRHTREFAEHWTGAGVDHDLVDVDGLRRSWLASRPAAPTAALLQQAWLATIDARAAGPRLRQ
jgi:asparagine synthase (glutamine-hydrolysing)